MRSVFILSVILLMAAVAAGQHWEFEKVDSVGAQPVWPAGVTVRALADGRIAVCYGVTDSGITRFAVRDSIWLYEDVGRSGSVPHPSFDVGAGGLVAACYEDTDCVWYAVRTDSGWQATRVPAQGIVPKLALDSAGVPFIVFQRWPSSSARVLLATRSDSVWRVDTMLLAVSMGYYEMSYGPVQFTQDNRATVFVGSFYDYNQRIYGGKLYLYQATGDSWQVLWYIDGSMLSRALSVGLDLTDSVQTCYWLSASARSELHCAGDILDDVAACGTMRFDSLNRPQVAYVASPFAGGQLRYAWRSVAGWQVLSVPDAGQVLACDMMLGDDGQPRLVYRCVDGRIWYARGVNVVALAAERQMEGRGRIPDLVVCRGILLLPERYRADLSDVTGRRVMDLQPGENDIRHVAPGVYFMQQKGPRGPGFQDSSVRKVVIQR